MSTHSQDGAWSADDIRANAQTWSLEGDAKLLDFMKNLSKKIEERGNRTTHNLHKIQLDLDKAQVALGNTTNRLMSLQHSQFVENRVYDDDETFASTANISDISQPTTEKPNLVDALQYALSSGVKMMDKYYEKVTFELSDDSEDDEVDEAGQSSKSIIFRPKDPYRNRPLPHLIGSKDWQEKWHIGLVDSDAEDVSDNTIDDMSESSSSASIASLQSHVPDSKSESESSVWGIGATSTILSTGTSHKKDIFNESSGDDEDNINRKPSGSISNSASGDRRSELRDEISDRPKITNRTAIEDPTINTIFRQQAQPAARLVAANLFDSEPPELDDSPNMSSAQNAERKPVNLFSDDYDDDDDGFDIFAAKETESESAVGPANASKIDPKPMKSINLFDGDDENDDALFGGPAVVENKPKTSILSSMPPKNALFQNLFDDEPPEDDFDFLTKPSAAAIHRKEEVVIKNVVAEPEKVPEKKVLMDSVEPLSTPIKEKSPVKQLPSKINLFDDDFDEDDSFEKLIGSKIKNAIEKKTVLDVEQVSVRPNVTDEAEPPPLSKNLFDDESDPEDPFIAVPASTPKFSELDTKDDFLDPIPPPVKVEEKTPFNYASPLLFNDYPPDDDDDFVAMPTTETKQPGEFYNDFSETVTVPSAEATKSQYAYMFSDVPPPDDDLFQPVKTKKTIAKDSEFSKKLNAFANPDKVIDELPKAMTATNKPKKLKMGKLDINVAALLPGAKRTVSNIKSDAFSASNRSGDETENVMAPTIVKRVDVENVDDSGRLTNLTRNRAKVQTRRPSTRRGRQQQYQKSLEEKDDTEEKINDVAPEKENFSNKVPVVKEAVPAAPTSAETVEPEPLAFPVKIEDLIEPDELTTEIKSATEPIPTGTKEEANTGIRTEVDPSPTENSFPAVAEQQPPPLKSTDLAFLNESDDDALDDDDWLSNTMASTKNQSTKSKTSSEKASKTEFASSLFDDDEKFEWKADSPPPVSKTTANVNTISNIVFSSDKPPPLLESKSIFDDFEEPDDDDIFSPMKQQRPVPTVTSAPDPVTILAPAPNPVPDSAPTSVPTRQTKATSLFGDEDENDDDLFGKSAALPKVKRKVAARAAVQPSKSLFGDDMSDDDDLFGAPKTTKKDTKPAAAAGEQPTVLNSKQVTPGKLFSDSDGDGDDDLFGSKTKPTSIAATKSVPSTSTQNRITKAKASSVTDQDPLADLLK